MIELTEEQGRRLASEAPVAIDPLTREEYVLVRRPVYERMKQQLADDTVLATGEQVDRVMTEDDANDPHLASYQSIRREARP